LYETDTVPRGTYSSKDANLGTAFSEAQYGGHHSGIEQLGASLMARNLGLSCGFCGRRFNDSEDLCSHESAEHGESPDGPSQQHDLHFDDSAIEDVQSQHSNKGRGSLPCQDGLAAPEEPLKQSPDPDSNIDEELPSRTDASGSHWKSLQGSRPRTPKEASAQRTIETGATEISLGQDSNDLLQVRLSSNDDLIANSR
jgi:hypothetical protein